MQNKNHNLNKKQDLGGTSGILAGIFFLLGPFMIIKDMVNNNDFIAYDANLEGSLTTYGGSALVVAAILAIPAIWLGVTGNKSNSEKSYLGPVIGSAILVFFLLWCLRAISW